MQDCYMYLYMYTYCTKLILVVARNQKYEHNLELTYCIPKNIFLTF